MDNLITILTPTYNRSNLLKKLYDSLLSQTNKNFEWLIVDDGSIDDTKMIIEQFIGENLITIKYVKKENGGKHTALNVGIKEITTKYTFIVDSDDWLTDNAIQTIIDYDRKYDNEKLCGFSFLRMYPDGKLNVSSGRDKDYIASYNQVRIYEQRFGDMAEVYKTSILQKYRFPEFDNEKFLGEDIVRIEIGKNYNLLFANCAIYISEYLSNGLTKNRRKNNILSCNGAFLRAKTMLSIKLRFKLRCKTIIQLIVYGKFCNKSFREISKISHNYFLATVLYIPSYFIFKRWSKIQ